jgi:hypothetical protein
VVFVAVDEHGRSPVWIASLNGQTPPRRLTTIEQRDLLIEEDPATYYLTDHYVDYPCVLVRLSRVSAESLRDLISGAHRFISATAPAKRRSSPSRRRVSTKKR